MIGAIVAEYTGSDSGLGYVIMQGTYRVDTPRVFAAVIVAAAAGLAFYGLIVFAERSALSRYYRGFDV
jgi:NitT/TauT family transport system permease protein